MNNSFLISADTTWLVCSSLLIPLGVLENVISVLVLMRQRFQTMPSRLSLIFLSVNDSIVLVIGLGRYWLRAVTGRTPANESEVFCRLLSYLVLTSSHISSTIVALICIERLVAVIFSHRFPSTYRLQVIGLYLTYTICGALNLHVLFDSRLEFDSKSNETGCTSINWPVAIIVDITDAIFLCILPFIIIISCNSCIIIKLKIVSHKVTSRFSSSPNNHNDSVKLNSEPQLTSTNASSRSRITKRDAKVTRTLLFITIAFFVFNVPFGIANILRTYASHTNTPSQNWNVVWQVTYILVYVNNCVNLPIYAFTHPIFREELGTIFKTRISHLFPFRLFHFS